VQDDNKKNIVDYIRSCVCESREQSLKESFCLALCSVTINSMNMSYQERELLFKNKNNLKVIHLCDRHLDRGHRDCDYDRDCGCADECHRDCDRDDDDDHDQKLENNLNNLLDLFDCNRISVFSIDL
jgi:hypothetical protein